MKHALRLITFAITIILLGACSSKKTATGTGVTAPDGRTLTEAAATWHTLKCPVKVNLDSPLSLGASGRATMVRDSMVHISMRLLGMEVAVMHADRDSAWLVDRYHKVYTAVPTGAVLSDYGVTLAGAQELLLGRATLEDLLPAAAQRVTFRADGFRETPVGQVASEVSFSLTLHNRKIAGSLRWDLNKAEWNVSVDTDWSVPAGYRRLDPKQLLQTLKTF